MIIISPYAKELPRGGANPKNYVHWPQLIALINQPIVQVGVSGETPLVPDFRTNLSLPELSQLILQSHTWISVDSMFQHLCWDLGKPGIVLWGQSNPEIYGHPENVNLLKGREYLFHNQFLSWDLIPQRNDCFVSPEKVVEVLNNHFPA